MASPDSHCLHLHPKDMILQGSATAFSRKQMVTWVRGLRCGAMLQADMEVQPGWRRQLFSPELHWIHSYARCAYLACVEMQAHWEAPHCHRYRSSDTGTCTYTFRGSERHTGKSPQELAKIFVTENSRKKIFQFWLWALFISDWFYIQWAWVFWAKKPPDKFEKKKLKK